MPKSNRILFNGSSLNGVQNGNWFTMGERSGVLRPVTIAITGTATVELQGSQ